MYEVKYKPFHLWEHHSYHPTEKQARIIQEKIIRDKEIESKVVCLLDNHHLQGD